MNTNASQFSSNTPSTPFEAAALKAVHSKRQKKINMHHAPSIDEQLKYANYLIGGGTLFQGWGLLFESR